MFCFCWQNPLLKLQALETDLCSAFLTHQEEAAQVHGVKDPAPASSQSAPAEGADATGKSLGSRGRGPRLYPQGSSTSCCFLLNLAPWETAPGAPGS